MAGEALGATFRNISTQLSRLGRINESQTGASHAPVVAGSGV
jgi:hypothetical protein